MASTFGSLKGRIADKLIVDDLDSQIGGAINLAVDYFENTRMWFNERRTPITLNVGDPLVPSIPALMLYEIADGGLTIDYGRQTFPIRKVSQAEYDNANSQGTGRPTIYVERAGGYYLYYYPDQAYAMNLFYVTGYADLVDDSDANDWLTYADRVIEAKALCDLYLDYRHEPDMALLYGKKAQEELDSVMELNIGRLTTGNLVNESFLM